MELHVEPRVVKKWDDFCIESPPYSIALDGYVRGMYKYDPMSKHVNFNHHEDVDRYTTRSTCSQAYIAIKQGMLEYFRSNGAVQGHIFVNDPDQDTSLAVWLLQNHERISGQRNEPLINRLVMLEDMLDTSAGAYPIDPLSNSMLTLGWIFEPYTKARTTGRVSQMDPFEMRNVIEAVCERISQYAMGCNQQIIPDVRYEQFAQGANWIMITEIGSEARSKLFSEGYPLIISLTERDTTTYTVVFAKRSPYDPLDLMTLAAYFNQVEHIDERSSEKWGGSNTIIASPRKSGTKLTPDVLRPLFIDYLKMQNDATALPHSGPEQE
jgi:hypothetical protein